MRRNEESARFSGINTRLVTVGSYVLAGLLAGISGIFLAFYTNSISPQSRQLLPALRNRRRRAGWMQPAGIPSSLNFVGMGAVVLIRVLADQIIKQRPAKQRVAR